MQKLILERAASLRLRAKRRFSLSNVKIVPFSTGSDTKASLDRAAKLKAHFGVTAANTGRKPTGVLIKGSPLISETANTTLEGAEIVNNVIANGTSEVENIAQANDNKDSAERTWLDSGYIEYMDNQRDKGWKS
jgi:hypothetical protein